MIRKVTKAGHHLGRPAGALRGRHAGDRAGDRHGRGVPLARRPRDGRGRRPRARDRRLRARAARRGPRPARLRPPARARAARPGLVRARGRPRPRRLRDPRPPRRRRPRRPPLRPAADGAPRRRRHRPRAASASTRRPRRSTAWSRGCSTPGGCSGSASFALRWTSSTARTSSTTTSARATSAAPTSFDLEFEDTNPFCGDEQHVFIALDDDGRVAEVAFEGKGCAISTAATSMLTEELGGQDPRGAAAARQGLRPRPARDRDLGDADEVRAARAQGGQVGRARRCRRLGGRGRAGRSGRRARPDASPRAAPRGGATARTLGRWHAGARAATLGTAAVLAALASSAPPPRPRRSAPRGFYGVVPQDETPRRRHRANGRRAVGTVRVTMPWSEIDRTAVPGELRLVEVRRDRRRCEPRARSRSCRRSTRCRLGLRASRAARSGRRRLHDHAAAHPGRAQRVALVPGRRGSPVWPGWALLDPESERARAADPHLADLERAELAGLLPAAARRRAVTPTC